MVYGSGLTPYSIRRKECDDPEPRLPAVGRAPRRRPAQDLRAHDGPRRLRPRGRARLRARPARTERRGQDHRCAVPRHAHRVRRGRRDDRRPRRAHATRRGARAHRARRPVPRRRRGPDGTAEPGAARAPQRPVQAPGGAPRRRPARGVHARGCRRPRGLRLLRRHAPTPRHRREPRPHARDPVPRRADDRTRPARASNRVAGASARSPPRAPRCCSPPSTSTRPTSSPIGSR